MYVLWGDVQYWDMFMQCYVSVQVRQSLCYLLFLNVQSESRCGTPDCLLEPEASLTRGNGLRQS